MIDEKAKRKPNFDERNSAPVVLADGQTWFVPKPWLEIRPVFRKGKAVTAYPVLTCGAELDALIEAMAACEDLRRAGRRPSRRWRRYLLRWHYELTDAGTRPASCVSGRPTSDR